MRRIRPHALAADGATRPRGAWCRMPLRRMGPNALEATEVVHLREHARVDTSAGELVDALPDAIVEDALPDALAADAIPDALVADCTPDAADGWEEFFSC